MSRSLRWRSAAGSLALLVLAVAIAGSLLVSRALFAAVRARPGARLTREAALAEL